MKYSLILLFMLGLGFFTLTGLTSNIHAGNSCYAEDSGSLRLGFFGLNKSSILDDGCQQVEAARMAAELGMDEHAKMIVCSHRGARSSFGSTEDCLGYRGSYKNILVNTQKTESYCYARSKKWYRKLTFTSGRSFRKCLRERS
jgi:hypothetical protein